MASFCGPIRCSDLVYGRGASCGAFSVRLPGRLPPRIGHNWTQHKPSLSARRPARRQPKVFARGRPPSFHPDIDPKLPLVVVGLQLAFEAGLHLLAAAAVRSTVLWLDRKLSERNAPDALDSTSSVGGDEASPGAAQRRPFLSILATTSVGAAQAPAVWLIPAVAAAHGLKLLLVLAEVAIERLEVSVHSCKTPVLAGLCLKDALRSMHYLEEAFVVGIRVAAVVALAWFLVRWKDRIVEYYLGRLRGQRCGTHAAGGGRGQLSVVEQVTSFLSTLASWLMASGGLLATAHFVGLDVRPLLTLGGFTSVALGIAAQSVAQNAISAVKLFVTQPFIAGERVSLCSSPGGAAISGWVQGVRPMYTLIKDDTFRTVAVPNRTVADMIVINESRLGPTRVQHRYDIPRQLTFSFPVPQDHTARVVKGIEEYIAQHPLVDKRMPHSCSVTQVTEKGATVTVLAHGLSNQAGLKWGSFVTDMATGIARIMADGREPAEQKK